MKKNTESVWLLPLRKAACISMAVATSLGFLASCSQSGHGYPETVSRLVFIGEAKEQRPLYWLDKDHLFVPGYAPDDPQAKQPGIFILDTRSHAYRRYADLDREYPSFCYHQGFVSYTIPSPDSARKRGQMEGKFGEEVLLPPNTKIGIGLFDNSSYVECPRVERGERLRPEHALLEKNHFPVHANFLRKEDGYIFAFHCKKPYCDGHPGPDREAYDEPLMLYRPGQSDPVRLPILVKELGLGSFVRYSEWANKYIIVPASRRDTPFGHGYSLAGKAPYQMYLMSPDGQVETRPMANGTWLTPGAAFLSRAGLVVTSTNAPSANSRQAGGWLVNPDGTGTKLFDHIPLAAGLSPDGCKLAYAANDFDAKTTDYVRIIDLCAKH